ncbi:MAG: glycosyltransferase [Ruminococcaceae bacterium]|nr:glycosyltransferase [Oscillospiraceae bacterium]
MDKKYTVIIPAYKPDHELLKTISGLVEAGLDDILVVNDGSGEKFEPVFDEVKKIPECTLLRHEVNRGKGAALKTAFDYFLKNRPNNAGVVTADADGQHLVCDIKAVGEKMAESGSTVLGVRDFSDPTVPPRSKAGNKITRTVFRLFFGMKITDTQTGLRAFPTKDIPVIATADGDRYEFETNMLYLINRKNLPLDEVKISTVYIGENSSSHFRVVRDSIRIYSLLIKFLVSFIASAAVYGIVSSLIGYFAGSVLPAIAGLIVPTAVGGVLAAAVHYIVNANLVFDKKIRSSSLAKFFAFALLQSVAASVLFYLSGVVLGVIPPLAALINTVLWVLIFFVSFRVQHKWVFNS